MTPDNSSEYLTTEELAARVRLTPATLHNWKYQGTLPIRPIKVGRRLLWPKAAADAWLARLESDHATAD